MSHGLAQRLLAALVLVGLLLIAATSAQAATGTPHDGLDSTPVVGVAAGDPVPQHSDDPDTTCPPGYFFNEEDGHCYSEECPPPLVFNHETRFCEMPAAGAGAGDIDCNDRIDPIDAFLVMQLIATLAGGLQCQQNADVNSNGSVDATDATLILRHAAGLDVGLP